MKRVARGSVRGEHMNIHPPLCNTAIDKISRAVDVVALSDRITASGQQIVTAVAL